MVGAGPEPPPGSFPAPPPPLFPPEGSGARTGAGASTPPGAAALPPVPAGVPSGVFEGEATEAPELADRREAPCGDAPCAAGTKKLARWLSGTSSAPAIDSLGEGSAGKGAGVSSVKLG